MKKALYIFIFFALFLSGCEKKPANVAPSSIYKLNDSVTSEGIRPGDDRAAFIKAYSNYTIQVAYNDLDSTYIIMSIRDIPYDEDISTMIANFFIDGKPVSEETLCRENQVQPSSLYSLLSSSEYLRNHDVIYRYLRFVWHNGTITEIESEELNYNETFETPRAEQ